MGFSISGHIIKDLPSPSHCMFDADVIFSGRSASSQNTARSTEVAGLRFILDLLQGISSTTGQPSSSSWTNASFLIAGLTTGSTEVPFKPGS